MDPHLLYLYSPRADQVGGLTIVSCRRVTIDVFAPPSFQTLSCFTSSPAKTLPTMSSTGPMEDFHARVTEVDVVRLARQASGEGECAAANTIPTFFQ